MSALPPGAIRLRPAVVTRWYGSWMIAVHTQDAVSEVCDAVEAGATRITIKYEDEQ